ncbi:hypothetical protein Afil01_49700 [Actinorhabdospora filicis]|uniref:Uncharacterized protein n=1 Tax=Actinorhabdospora filicis TaxID=1785913 RepID=A0A9W6SPV1_9ACTN|nr:hypothetical protein [Actinorhabdospora filicis]GLZ80163.1 hypothetical protein Afil01_49700 [Actinorhabdospora filicis]
MKCILTQPPDDPDIPWRVVVVLIFVLGFVAAALLAGRPLDVIAGLLGAVFTTATWLEAHLPDRRPRA